MCGVGEQSGAFDETVVGLKKSSKEKTESLDMPWVLTLVRPLSANSASSSNDPPPAAIQRDDGVKYTVVVVLILTMAYLEWMLFVVADSGVANLLVFNMLVT